MRAPGGGLSKPDFLWPRLQENSCRGPLGVGFSQALMLTNALLNVK